MNKIIQISSDPPTKDYPCGLFALCDDGTVWYFNWFEQTWSLVPPIRVVKEK